MIELIYETVHGSRAYGLAREGSDTDIKGVIVGPPAWYFGFASSPEQVELGPDHVRFEIRKLFRLLAAGNPTLIELLWTRPEHHLVVTAAGERLLAARRQFLSTQVADTFGGYALSQLKRIKGHRAWLLDPPTAQPRRGDFGLPDKPLLGKDQLGAAQALLDRPDATGLDDLTPNFLDVLDRERRYRSAKAQWTQRSNAPRSAAPSLGRPDSSWWTTYRRFTQPAWSRLRPPAAMTNLPAYAVTPGWMRTSVPGPIAAHGTSFGWARA